MAIKVGENVGPYRVTEQLGQGGMATVFKAFHAALDRYVALKVLHPAFNEDKTFIGRFEREAKVIAKLEHPNIVPIYDYSEYNNQPYLVMKYIEGETLKARFNRGPLTPEEIENVINSVGSALSYAHNQGILHRDIKPSNVLTSPEGTMYLADFGLARIAAQGESTLSVDSIMGTPQYISPEQAMGKKELDAGTDIYSFGVMLYELVVGQVPFNADTPFSIIHDHIYTPLPLPVEVNPNVPETVQRVLLKALAKERSDRYKTIDEMMKAFKTAWVEAGVPMQGTSIKMKPPKPADIQKAGNAQSEEPVAATVAAKSPKKKRSSLFVFGIAFLVLICLIGTAFGAWKFGMFAQFLPTEIAVETQFSLATEPPATEKPTEQPVVEPTPTEGLAESPEVQAARENAQLHPNDSRVLLKYSLALYDDGRFGPAMEQLKKAADIDRRDIDFYLIAADEYKNRNEWIPVASMYLRLAPFADDPKLKESDPQFNDHLHESVYIASEDERIQIFLPFESIAAYDQALSIVARGRYELYHGDIEQAFSAVDGARAINKEMGEASLLQAEIELKTGNTANAKALMESISGYAAHPEWIRNLATKYYDEIK